MARGPKVMPKAKGNNSSSRTSFMKYVVCVCDLRWIASIGGGGLSINYVTNRGWSCKTCKKFR